MCQGCIYSVSGLYLQLVSAVPRWPKNHEEINVKKTIESESQSDTIYTKKTTCWQQSIRYSHTSLWYNSWFHPLKTSIWWDPLSHIHRHTQKTVLCPRSKNTRQCICCMSLERGRVAQRAPLIICTLTPNLLLFMCTLCACHKQCAQSHYHYRENQSY